MVNADPGHFGPNSMMWKVNKEISLIWGCQGVINACSSSINSSWGKASIFLSRDPWKRLIRTLSLQNSVTLEQLKKLTIAH